MKAIPLPIPQRLAALFLLLLFAALQACSSLGLQEPQNFEDGLQYGRANVAAAYRTVGDLKATRAITGAKGKELFATVESVEIGLDDAELFARMGDQPKAQVALQAALLALKQVQAKLNEAKPK